MSLVRDYGLSSYPIKNFYGVWALGLKWVCPCVWRGSSGLCLHSAPCLIQSPCQSPLLVLAVLVGLHQSISGDPGFHSLFSRPYKHYGLCRALERLCCCRLNIKATFCLDAPRKNMAPAWVGPRHSKQKSAWARGLLRDFSERPGHQLVRREQELTETVFD